jgi:ferric-dicitrate binding protein FerR (iron transport regulator)
MKTETYGLTALLQRPDLTRQERALFEDMKRAVEQHDAVLSPLQAQRIAQAMSRPVVLPSPPPSEPHEKIKIGLENPRLEAILGMLIVAGLVAELIWAHFHR